MESGAAEITSSSGSTHTPIMVDVVGDTEEPWPVVHSKSQETTGTVAVAVTTKSRPIETGRVSRVVVYALIVSIGGVIGGYSHGFPSPTLIDLQLEYDNGERVTAFPSTCFYAGLFGAIGPIGALCGGLTAGPVSDRIGRSSALVLMNIPHLIGWLGQAYAHWMTTTAGFTTILMLGRWFTGFGTGWGSLVISVYMVEISPAKLKGLFGSMYWFSTSIGILLVYALGAIPGFMYYDLSLSTAALVVPCISLYCFLPETPRWLISHKKTEEAYRVLKKLRGRGTDVDAEMKELQTNYAEKTTFVTNLKYLTKRSAYVPLILSVLLMIFQQFTGTNVVMFYAGTILTDAKVVNAKQVAGYAVGATQVITTLFSVLLVDCVGRKVLLVLSSIIVCTSTGLLGLYYFLTEYVCEHKYHMNATSHIPSDVPIFCDPVSSKFFILAIFSVMLFIVAFSTGWATIPWVMMSELSPLRVRGTLSGIATTVNWTTAAFLTGLFPNYQGVVHHYGSWWTLTAITLLSIPFVVIWIPETKGQSLEQIERGMKSGDNKKVDEISPLLQHK